MKRVIFYAALCCALMACGGNGDTMVNGKAFEVSGRVKRCNTVEFDENGKVTRFTNLPDAAKYFYDDKDRLVRIEYLDSVYVDQEPFLTTLSFTYNADGTFKTVVEDGVCTNKCYYFYDGKNVVESVDTSNCGDEYSTSVTKCVIENTDDHGNWIKAKLDKSTEYAGCIEKQSSEITRIITYFD